MLSGRSPVRAQSVERLSGCNGYKLRSTLLSQAKVFVEARHEANKQTLVKRLDAEKWAQVGREVHRVAAVAVGCVALLEVATFWQSRPYARLRSSGGSVPGGVSAIGTWCAYV